MHGRAEMSGQRRTAVVAAVEHDDDRDRQRDAGCGGKHCFNRGRKAVGFVVGGDDDHHPIEDSARSVHGRASSMMISG
jgi:hypothetical protein